jgi:non-specific serine/threonine protein kinase
MHGDYALAKEDAETAVALCRADGLSSTLFVALTLLGILSTGAGDWGAAALMHDEAFQLAWQLRDPWWVASSLNNLGLIAMERGDHEVARSRLEQALAGFRLTGDRLHTAHSLDSLARVNIKLNDLAAARSNFLEALTVELAFADTSNIAISLEGLAEVDDLDGRSERAITLVSAARSLRKPLGVELAPEWKDAVDKTLAATRMKVGKAEAEGAWKRGAAMSLDEAVRYANGTAVPTTQDGDSPLTGREKQVALLIAEGLTNVEIAGRLRMAERTADAHVEHIRNKLGLRSRAQIAVWAHERLAGR